MLRWRNGAPLNPPRSDARGESRPSRLTVVFVALMAAWALTDLPAIHPVRASTSDALYREYDDYLMAARERGCDIVNLDSTHLYAASRVNDAGRILSTVECGVISDVAGTRPEESWETQLPEMLGADDSSAMNPLGRTGQIVKFYVEQLAPVLATLRS